MLPLESLLAPPTILEPSAATPQAPSEVCCISSDTEEASPAPIAETPGAADEFEAQVHDWRFSELRTTDLAALREVDVSTPFRLPALEDEHWQGLSTTPNKHGPQHAQPAWYDAATAHWAALPDPSIQPSNASTASGIKCTATATPRSLSPRPLQLPSPPFPSSPGKKVLCSIEAIRTMWRSAKASMARHVGVPADWHPGVGGR